MATITKMGIINLLWNHQANFNQTWLEGSFVDPLSKLEVTQIIHNPEHSEVEQHIALPSVVFPSDHIAQICDLKWNYILEWYYRDLLKVCWWFIFFIKQFMILFLALLLPDHSCQNWPYPQNIMKDKDLIFFNKITCIRRLLSICQLSYF
jgi:hypothetical protein